VPLVLSGLEDGGPGHVPGLVVALADQVGSDHGPAGVRDQAAVGLLVEGDLGDAQHHQRVDEATEDGDHQGDPHRDEQLLGEIAKHLLSAQIM
jgi:hypothetical protein